MSGGIGKKLYEHRLKIVPTTVKRVSAPVAKESVETENRQNARKKFVTQFLEDSSYSDADVDLQYEMLAAKRKGEYNPKKLVTSLWDAPTLNEYRQHEKLEIEQTLYKNDIVEEGVHTCKRCACKKTIVTSKQTRGFDEGETTTVTCIACKFRWNPE